MGQWLWNRYGSDEGKARFEKVSWLTSFNCLPNCFKRVGWCLQQLKSRKWMTSSIWPVWKSTWKASGRWHTSPWQQWRVCFIVSTHYPLLSQPSMAKLVVGQLHISFEHTLDPSSAKDMNGTVNVSRSNTTWAQWSLTRGSMISRPSLYAMLMDIIKRSSCCQSLPYWLTWFFP